MIRVLLNRVYKGYWGISGESSKQVPPMFKLYFTMSNFEYKGYWNIIIVQWNLNVCQHTKEENLNPVLTIKWVERRRFFIKVTIIWGPTGKLSGRTLKFLSGVQWGQCLPGRRVTRNNLIGVPVSTSITQGPRRRTYSNQSPWYDIRSEVSDYTHSF